MKAEELDWRFDDGEDVLEFFDVSNLKRPGLAMKSINISLPVWMLEAIEKESQRLEMPPESVIELWIAEHLPLAEVRSQKGELIN